MHYFNVKREHEILLPNIIFKTFYLFESPKATKEPRNKGFEIVLEF